VSATDIVLLNRAPELTKLLEELPEGDPDARLVRVWAKHCKGVHLVPANQEVQVDFGVWRGPRMRTLDAIIYCSYLHLRCTVRLTESNCEIIAPGDVLIATLTVDLVI
jgi:hypothetical protein